MAGQKTAESNASGGGDEASLRAIVDASPECIIATDRAGRVLAFNPAAERVFGYARDEALKRDLESLILPPPSREQEHGAGIARYLAAGESADVANGRVELTGVRKNGEAFPVEVAIARLPVADHGAPAFAVFARDVAEAGAYVEALRQSEERFRILVEQVKDYAIFMLDPEGNIATWNEGAERFQGYTASEIIGQHFSRFYTPEDIARRHPWNELVIAAREGRYEEEGWRVRKDGSRFWSSVVITALRSETGELRGFAKVTRDMTERRARERELATAQLAEQQRRVLKEVLASVTGGRLILCENREELPDALPAPEGLPGAAAAVALAERSLSRLRRRATEAARQAGLDSQQTGRLLTAANEAAMNAVVHAGGGTATVGVDREAGTVRVWVEDAGGGIEMSRLPKATLDRGFTTAGTLGYGFKLLLATADRVWLLTGPGGTTVVLQVSREEAGPPWLHDKLGDRLRQNADRGDTDVNTQGADR